MLTISSSMLDIFVFNSHFLSSPLLPLSRLMHHAAVKDSVNSCLNPGLSSGLWLWLVNKPIHNCSGCRKYDVDTNKKTFVLSNSIYRVTGFLQLSTSSIHDQFKTILKTHYCSYNLCALKLTPVICAKDCIYLLKDILVVLPWVALLIIWGSDIQVRLRYSFRIH